MSTDHGVINRARSVGVVLLLFASFLSGCATPRGSVAEIQSLLATDQDWAAAARASDIDRLLEFWTDDAVIYAQGRPPVVGKPAIREMVTNVRQNPGYSMTWKTTKAVVGKSGDIAYTVGSHKVTLPDHTGTLVPMAGYFICTWRKENNKWRCDTECWNASPGEH